MKRWILALVGTWASIATVAACSSGSSSANPGQEGGVDGGADASSGPLPYFGTMTAAKTSAATPVYAITGAFVSVGDAGAAAPADASVASLCTGTASGNCCYLPPSAASDAGAADAGTLALVGAGTITITDGTTPIAALNPASNGGYGITSANNNPSVKWQPGDTLTFSAAGAVVQPFKGSVVAVQDFAGVVPALSATASTVALGSDFVVKWTPGNGTNVRLVIGAAKGTAPAGTFTCIVPDSAGTLSVPAALLSHLASGDTGLAALTRGTVTPATGANATVELVSTVTTGGTLKFQ